MKGQKLHLGVEGKKAVFAAAATWDSVEKGNLTT